MTTYFIKENDSLRHKIKLGKLVTTENGYEVYSLLEPSKFTDLCFKKFVNTQHNEGVHLRIDYMMAHSPQTLYSTTSRICWPMYPVIDENDTCLGYLTQYRFDNSVALDKLIATKQTTPKEWHKFLPNNSDSFYLILTFCAHISQALGYIADLNHYAFGPSHIMLTNEGQVSLINFETILVDKIEGYNSRYLTGYLPPESAYKDIQYDTSNKSWGRFTLAVMLYQLLFGVHPYAATFKHPHHQLYTIDDKVNKGLFVQGEGKKYVSTLPKEHEGFNKLDHRLKTLFYLAFDNESYLNRPSANDWAQTLLDIISNHSQGFKDTALALPIANTTPTSSQWPPPPQPPAIDSQTYNDKPLISAAPPLTNTFSTGRLWTIISIVLASVVVIIIMTPKNYQQKALDMVKASRQELENSKDFAPYSSVNSYSSEPQDVVTSSSIPMTPQDLDPIGNLTSEHLYVLTKGANIRVQPSLTSPIVAEVSYNSPLTKTTLPLITDDDARVWIHVATRDNIRGWMSSKTLSKFPRTILHPRCGVSDNEVGYTVRVAGANVRSAPNKDDSTVIGVIQQGQLLCPTHYVDTNDSSIGRWLGFTLTNGEMAWIAETLLESSYNSSNNTYESRPSEPTYTPKPVTTYASNHQSDIQPDELETPDTDAVPPNIEEDTVKEIHQDNQYDKVQEVIEKKDWHDGLVVNEKTTVRPSS